MAEWSQIPIEVGDIKKETDKAYLIQLPHEAARNLDVPASTSFWFPRKLVRGERGNLMMSLPPDFEFRMFTSSMSIDGGNWEKKPQGAFSSAQLVENWGLQSF